MPAHWWVEPGLGPLMGRAKSRGVSKDGCGLRKSLGCLSADAWGCVRVPLAFWPEASQLQAVEWGRSRCQRLKICVSASSQN